MSRASRRAAFLAELAHPRGFAALGTDQTSLGDEASRVFGRLDGGRGGLTDDLGLALGLDGNRAVLATVFLGHPTVVAHPIRANTAAEKERFNFFQGLLQGRVMSIALELFHPGFHDAANNSAHHAGNPVADRSLG